MKLLCNRKIFECNTIFSLNDTQAKDFLGQINIKSKEEYLSENCYPDCYYNSKNYEWCKNFKILGDFDSEKTD
jgi:CTP:phosphocholine cytidylyltransferase-like protein